MVPEARSSPAWRRQRRKQGDKQRAGCGVGGLGPGQGGGSLPRGAFCNGAPLTGPGCVGSGVCWPCQRAVRRERVIGVRGGGLPKQHRSLGPQGQKVCLSLPLPQAPDTPGFLPWQLQRPAFRPSPQGTPDCVPSSTRKSGSPSAITSPPSRRHPETGRLWKGEAEVTSSDAPSPGRTPVGTGEQGHPPEAPHWRRHTGAALGPGWTGRRGSERLRASQAGWWLAALAIPTDSIPAPDPYVTPSTPRSIPGP